MQLAAFDGPSPKTPFGRKNLAKISYASRVIAHFVPNVVAMATGVGRGKMQLAAFDGPSPKTPLEAQKYRKNLLHKLSHRPFCPKFRRHGNGGQSGKCSWEHSMAHPRKPPYRRKNIAKISQKITAGDCKLQYIRFGASFQSTFRAIQIYLLIYLLTL